MPQPVPHLHEILALEAKVRADKYDLYPLDNYNKGYVLVFLSSGGGAKLEALLLKDIVYIKH